VGKNRNTVHEATNRVHPHTGVKKANAARGLPKTEQVINPGGIANVLNTGEVNVLLRAAVNVKAAHTKDVNQQESYNSMSLKQF